MKGRVNECKYKKVIIRVHFPDDKTEEEVNKNARKATEKFLKKILQNENKIEKYKKMA